MSDWTLFLVSRPIDTEELVALGRTLMAGDKVALLRPAAESLSGVEHATIQVSTRHWMTVDCSSPHPWALARIDHSRLAALVLSSGRTATWHD